MSDFYTYPGPPSAWIAHNDAAPVFANSLIGIYRRACAALKLQLIGLQQCIGVTEHLPVIQRWIECITWPALLVQPHLNVDVSDFQGTAHVKNLQPRNAWISRQAIAIGLEIFLRLLCRIPGIRGISVRVRFPSESSAFPDRS